MIILLLLDIYVIKQGIVEKWAAIGEHRASANVLILIFSSGGLTQVTSQSKNEG